MKKLLTGTLLVLSSMSAPTHQVESTFLSKNNCSIENVGLVTDTVVEIIKDSRHNILFTIDDGPSKYTLDIAKTLDSLNYKGIFFMVTRGIKENRKSDLVEILKMGHEIGNHSYSHPNFKRLSLEEVKKEILQSDSIISELYKEAGIKQTKKYIRYPYGLEPNKKFINEVNEFLDSLGYEKPMFWRMSVDLLDWQAEPELEKIQKMKNGDTILLHEREYTPQTIREIVKSVDGE